MRDAFVRAVSQFSFMEDLSEARLSAFIERSWQFHEQQNGGNQLDTVKRTAQDLGTHYGLLPDEALVAVWRFAPDR